jgi:hypothetical protein
MPTMLQAAMIFSLRFFASASSSSLSAPGLIQISAICFRAKPSSSRDPVHFALVRVHRNHRVAFRLERTKRLVPELAPIARRADHCDDLGHAPIMTK